VGAANAEALISNRPYFTVEELLFPKSGLKPSKTILDRLIRINAIPELIDNRFTGAKHFWAAIALNKPTSIKKLNINILESSYRELGEFDEKELITFQFDLTKVYPLGNIVPPEIVRALELKFIQPIAKFDSEVRDCWFVLKRIEKAKTKNGKEYIILHVTDSTYQTTKIKVWNSYNKNLYKLNHVYLSRDIEYSEQWGFSYSHIIKDADNLEIFY